MNLQNVTEEQFNATVGKTFTTVGTTNGVVYSELPNEDGLHRVMEFSCYKDYITYQNKDEDECVSLDLNKLQASIDSGTIEVPAGLSNEERRAYVKQKLGELK